MFMASVARCSLTKSIDRTTSVSVGASLPLWEKNSVASLKTWRQQQRLIEPAGCIHIPAGEGSSAKQRHRDNRDEQCQQVRGQQVSTGQRVARSVIIRNKYVMVQTHKVTGCLPEGCHTAATQFSTHARSAPTIAGCWPAPQSYACRPSGTQVRHSTFGTWSSIGCVHPMATSLAGA